ncbi:MAG: hypothetical protein KDC38_13985, partial [Planctomycetes bacterium]|nr:hypothetical protein [Planctomycetota bacterium]
VDALGYYLPGTWVALSSGETGVVVLPATRSAGHVWILFRDGAAVAPRLFPDDGDVGISIVGAVEAPTPG